LPQKTAYLPVSGPGLSKGFPFERFNDDFLDPIKSKASDSQKVVSIGRVRWDGF
jgi:hypothetical protein